jgi:hypothetical protein
MTKYRRKIFPFFTKISSVMNINDDPIRQPKVIHREHPTATTNQNNTVLAETMEKQTTRTISTTATATAKTAEEEQQHPQK